MYIISNIGSFGEHVYKIGMTRRLEPEDRVKELGDASVPFGFDIHALIYSDDAPGLETTLHRLFHGRRVNGVNLRREFFRVTLDEITQAVAKHDGKIEVVRGFIADAEAKEWRQILFLSMSGARTVICKLCEPQMMPITSSIEKTKMGQITS